MLETNLTHWKIVNQSLIGRRDVDEQTYTSAAVLKGRLERLKESHNSLKDVTLSSDVLQLAKHNRQIAVS